MRTIVFVLGYYIPQQNANLNCVLNVLNELRSRGYKIIVICGTPGDYKDEVIDGVRIIRVHRNDFEKTLQKSNNGLIRTLLRVLRVLHNICVLPFYPNTEVLFSNRLFHALRKTVNCDNAECIVGNVFPISSVCAVRKIKKRFKDIKTIGYYLDMIHSTAQSGVASFISRKWLYIYGDIKEFNTLDTVILPECGKDYYEQRCFAKYKGKIEYANFPVFEISKETTDPRNDKTLVVYAGSINATDRNPAFLLKCLEESNLQEYSFRVCGSTEDTSSIYKLEKEYPSFEYLGTLEKREANKELRTADYIVAFGNEMKGVVPSKIFELFGLKKRLIYVAKNEDDSGLRYVNAYPDKCILYREDSFQYSVKKLNCFFSSKPENIDDEYLLKTYYSATANVVADIIARSIE